MDKWHVPQTALLDDQFSVMPRKYSNAYFLHESFNASDMASLPDHGFTRHTLDGQGKRAVTELYGATAGIQQLSWVYFYHPFAGVLKDKGGYSVGHDHRHLCCERLITWRLVGRLVPYRLVPFNLGLEKLRTVWGGAHKPIVC